MAPKSPFSGKNKIPFKSKGVGKSPYKNSANAPRNTPLSNGGSIRAKYNVQYGVEFMDPNPKGQKPGTTKVQSKNIPRKGNSIFNALKKSKKGLSFFSWKTSRNFSKAARSVLSVLPKSALSFLTKGGSIAKFIPRLALPLAKFIPYVGFALTVGGIGYSLWQLAGPFLPKSKTVKRSPKASLSSFRGGQVEGAQYKFAFTGATIAPGTGELTASGGQFIVQGPIKSITIVGTYLDAFPGNPSSTVVLVENEIGVTQGVAFRAMNPGETVSTISVQPVHHGGPPDPEASPFNPLLTKPLDSYNTGQRINSPWSQYLPGGKLYNPPPKRETKTREAIKRKPLGIVIPARVSTTIAKPDGTTTIVAPGPEPRIINIPRTLPGQLTADNQEPNYQPAVLPLTITSPTAAPLILTSPGTGEITINQPGTQPFTFSPIAPGQGALPLSTIQPIRENQPRDLLPLAIPTSSPVLFPPVPQITAPLPQTQPATPTPAVAPAPAPTPDGINFEDLLIPAGITGGLVGLGLLIKEIHTRTSPQEIGRAAEAATCRTTLPGGCSSNLANNTANQSNQNLLNGLGVGAQGAELALLGVINNKLGPQMLGGISSGLGRLSKSLGLDRLLNVLTTVTVLHNAVMLSGSLKVTLLEMLSSLGNATGLLQTSENENIDLNAVLNKGLNELGELIVGEENWDGIKATYKKHNRIYQSAANIINSVQGIMNGIANVVSIGAQYSGKIGNALKGNGVIGENSFAWMNEDVSAKTGKLAAIANFGETVGETSELLENVSEASESVVEIQQQATEIVNQNKVFKKTLEDAQKPTPIENKAVKDAEALAKANATATPTGEDAQGLLSFLADD